MKQQESLYSACSYSTSMLFSWIIYSVLSNVEGGGLLEIQKLPRSGITNKPSSTLVLFVNEFGAKGDGFTDDTKVGASTLLCSSLPPFS